MENFKKHKPSPRELLLFAEAQHFCSEVEKHTRSRVPRHAPTSSTYGPYFSLPTVRTVTGQAGDGLIDSFIMPHCFLDGLILRPCRCLLSAALCKQISCCPEWQLLTRDPPVSRTGAEAGTLAGGYIGGWRSE